MGNKITGDCLRHVPGHSLPCFSGSPAPAYWRGSFMCELFTEVGFAVATTPAPESGIKTPSHKDLMLGLGLFFPALSLQVSLRAVPAGYPAGGS